MDGLTLGQIMAHGFVKKQSAEFIGKANLNSPALTGSPSAPTPLFGSGDNSVANAFFVQIEKEYLNGLNQVAHFGTVIDSCIDYPYSHSDGGAWTDMCQDKSWYKETLGGTAWLNARCPDEATARAVIQSYAKPNLVTNGTFDTTATGWTFASGAPTVSSGEVTVTNIGTAQGNMYQAITTVVGKSYLASCTARVGNVASASMYIGSNVGGSQLGSASTTSNANTVIYVSFVATGTTTYLATVNQGTNNGTAVYDNISLKEIDSSVSTSGYAYQLSLAPYKFYSLTGTSGQNEIFRGIKREYPKAGVYWICEAARLIGYDLGTGAMWRVFSAVGTANWWTSGSTITSIFAKDGSIIVGSNGSGIRKISFPSDEITGVGPSFNSYTGRVSISNSTAIAWSALSTSYIIGGAVNDIVATVLDGSPVDLSTGLPALTIVVATTVGNSVIRQDGVIVNSADTVNTFSLSISGSTLYLSNRYASTAVSRFRSLIGIAAGWTATNNIAYSFSGGVGDESKILAAGNNLISLSSPNHLFITRINQTVPNLSMRADVTYLYNSGWQIGDARLSTLAGTTAETIVGSGELVPDPTLTSATGLTVPAGWIISGGVATCDGTTSGVLVTPSPLIVGKTYVATLTVVTRTAGTLYLPFTGAGALNFPVTSTGTFTRSFVADTPSLYIAYSVGFIGSIDNISVKLGEPDRSIKNNGLIVNGTLTKRKVDYVDAGNQGTAGLVAYSGFSAANYLEQPYSSSLDFGTGDFSVMGWYKYATGGGTKYLFQRSDGTNTGILGMYVTAGQIAVQVGAIATLTGGFVLAEGDLVFLCLRRVSGIIYLSINGADVYNVSRPLTVSVVASLFVGTDAAKTAPMITGSLALWRISATPPSADQIAQIYRDELPLFQPGTQCTIAGTSMLLGGYDYDTSTDLVHIGTAWGRTSFKGLLQVDSEISTVGSITSISASRGAVLTAGTNAKISTPSIAFRDDLVKRDQQFSYLNKALNPLTFTATSGQTVFAATKGYDVLYVYVNGLLKTFTTDYTVSYDGFQNTVTTVSGVPANQKVTLILTRSK